MEFDFSEELDGIDASPSPVITAEVVKGEDAAPGDILDGSPQISGAKVLQRMSGGADRVHYRFVCTVHRGDDIRVLAAIMIVKSA